MSPIVRNRTAGFDGFARQGLVVGADGQDDALSAHNLAFVGEIQGWQGDLLALDVLPDIELGPVADGEGADMLAGAMQAVVEIPELGALVFGVPLAEAVPEAEEALLGAGLFLVAPGAAQRAVELEFGNGIEQGDGLEGIAAGIGAFFLLGPALADGILDGGA
jgi:hypothetical protein